MLSSFMGFDKCIMTCIHCYSIIQNSFTALNILCAPPIHSFSSSPEPLATTDLFTVSVLLLFPECHAVGIIQHVAFLDGFLSLSNMHLRFLHVFVWLDSSFIFIAEWYSIVWMYHSLFNHLPIERHLGCFQILATMTKAVVNICV